MSKQTLLRIFLFNMQTNLILVFFIIASQLTFAAQNSATEFVQFAEETANLESDFSRMKLGWNSMIAPLFNAPEFNNKPNFNLELIKTPARYYAQPLNFRRKLKSENRNIQLLEKYFPQKDYEQMQKNISSKLTALKIQRSAVPPEEIKKLISQFHEEKLKIFSPTLDDLIGIDYESTESTISKDDYKDVNANIDTLKERSQSNYEDIRLLFQSLKLNQNDVFYDLGSGYGRVILYGGIINPTVPFKGIELVRERVSQANALAGQLNLKNVNFIANDILVEPFDDGTVFYIYASFPSIMKSVMEKLRLVAKKHAIRIVCMGPSSAYFQNVAWLEIEKDLRPGRFEFPLEIYKSKF